MALINIISQGTPIYTFTGGTKVGTGPEVIDGNWSTYFGGSSSGGTGASALAIAEFDFPAPYLIQEIDFQMSASAVTYANNGGSSYATCYVQYYDTSWHTVIGSTYTASGGSQSTSSINPGRINLAGLNLSGVIKLKAYCLGSAGAGDDKPSTTAGCAIYELTAIASLYLDSGLRIKKADGTILRIGCEPLTSAHKIRLMKTGGVVGIPLVAIGDPQSCGLRINAAGTKAFPLAT